MLTQTIQKFRLHIALAVAVSGVSLAAGEIVCRIAGQYNDTNPVFLLPHPTLPYTMQPRYSGSTILGHSIDINSQGFRDSEHTLQKRLGSTRIIALGDSITFGYGVEARETYPPVIEDLLNSGAQSRYEVLNFGCSGYNLADYYNQFEQIGLPFSPDAVVIGLSSSDFTREEDIEVIRDGVGMRPGSVWVRYHVPSFVLRILRKSALYLTVGNSLKRLSASKQPQSSEPSPQETAATLEFVSGYLSKFNALGKRLQIPIIYAYFPKQVELQSNKVEHPEFLHRIAEKTKEYGNARFANMMDDLQPFKDRPQEVFQRQDFVHPTPQGHAVYARRIAAELASVRLSRLASGGR